MTETTVNLLDYVVPRPPWTNEDRCDGQWKEDGRLGRSAIVSVTENSLQIPLMCQKPRRAR
jgi:hypothetical protein